jgi:replicative DNA helicase
MAQDNEPGTSGRELDGLSVAALMEQLDRDDVEGRTKVRTPLPTGFEPIDHELGGGLQTHDLTLIGGRPGVGKTIAALQWARNMALQGSSVAYVCYEHDESHLLLRLLCLEMGELAHPDNAPALDKLRRLAREATSGHRQFVDAVASEPLLAAAHQQMAAYSERLHLVRGSGTRTSLAHLESLAARLSHGRGVLVIDYVQKIPVLPEPKNSFLQTLRIAEALKEMSLSHDIAVVGIVAAEHQGLTARRVLLHHMRGAAALAYEADVIITLNAKPLAVSDVHQQFDPLRAAEFKNYVVFTLEKNRGGPAELHFEFRKDFSNFRFEPAGRHVAERLYESPAEAT